MPSLPFNLQDPVKNRAIALSGVGYNTTVNKLFIANARRKSDERKNSIFRFI